MDYKQLRKLPEDEILHRFIETMINMAKKSPQHTREFKLIKYEHKPHQKSKKIIYTITANNYYDLCLHIKESFKPFRGEIILMYLDDNENNETQKKQTNTLKLIQPTNDMEKIVNMYVQYIAENYEVN